jgi:hypothetical protein
MNLKSYEYNRQFLDALQHGQMYNDAAKYGIKIRESQTPDGARYWRVIGAHHLSPAENEGNHTILVEALDEEGNRIRGAKDWAASTFENSADAPKASPLDKRDYDPAGCDFPMFKEATYSVWIKGHGENPNVLNDPSERVEKLHTRHSDEAPGNTYGHHSFYVVFQRTLKGPTVLDEGAVLLTARRLRDEQIAGDAPFAIYARQNDLGAPITTEFSAGGYRARGYVRGIVYAPLVRPKEIKHMAW